MYTYSIPFNSFLCHKLTVSSNNIGQIPVVVVVVFVVVVVVLVVVLIPYSVKDFCNLSYCVYVVALPLYLLVRYVQIVHIL